VRLAIAKFSQAPLLIRSQGDNNNIYCSTSEV
jgi:hypothetical protein